MDSSEIFHRTPKYSGVTWKCGRGDTSLREVKFNVLITIAFLICCPSIGFAQLDIYDSTEHPMEYSSYILLEDVWNLEDTAYLEDSTIESMNQIHPGRRAGFWMDQGFIGSPILLNPIQSGNTAGFALGGNIFEGYNLSSTRLRNYRGTMPRTLLRYAQGGGELIYITAEHDQQIFDRWTMGIKYEREKIQNVLYNNLPEINAARMADNYRLQWRTHFANHTRSYEVFAHLNWNKYNTQETGGSVDTLFYNGLEGRQKSFSVGGFLTDADLVYKDAEFRVTQLFRPSLRMDSFDSTFNWREANLSKGFWYHTLSHRKNTQWLQLAVPNEVRFPARQYTAATNDSLVGRVLENTIGRKTLMFKSRFMTDLYARHEYISVFQSAYGRYRYNNVRVGGKMALGSVSKFQTLVSADAALLGFNAGDYEVQGKVTGNWRVLHMEISGSSRLYEPEFYQQAFVTNQYSWVNDFKKVKWQELKFKLEQREDKFGLDLQAGVVNDFVFHDTTGFPVQLNDAFTSLKATAFGKVELFNHLKVEQRFVFQQVSTDVLPVPALSSVTRIFAQSTFFKGNMEARLGVDVYYSTPFTGYYYNPLTRAFQVGTMELGNMPVVDVYLLAKIRTMHLFLSFDQVNQDVLGIDVYSAALYPSIGRRLRVGVTWRLFN
jgi:hypothetical protein